MLPPIRFQQKNKKNGWTKLVSKMSETGETIMPNSYLCKIATPEEMNRKWDEEIERNADDRQNWILWKRQFLENFKKGAILSYYGILNGAIICEATAAVRPEAFPNSDRLIGEKTAYLYAFRTVEEYQGKGYFSKLFQFMLKDLRRKGFEKATLGVEPAEEKNRKIYEHYGFTEKIKSSTETYPDGTVIQVDYYGKSIQ